jgi:hypothetical protein
MKTQICHKFVKKIKPGKLLTDFSLSQPLITSRCRMGGHHFPDAITVDKPTKNLNTKQYDFLSE